MTDADDVLVDDRAVVELGGHVVRGDADELHAAVVRLVVGATAAERREERVVDVDDPFRPPSAELRREDLHVAREDDERDAVRGEDVLHRALLFRFRRGRDRQVVELHTEPARDLALVGVVADRHRDLHRELAAP